MTYEELWRKLTPIYDRGEAKAVARYVLDVRFGLSAADVYCGKVTQLSADECLELEKIITRLAAAEPVQYVLGSADFCGRVFRVSPGVLIPRPETEELVRKVVADLKVERMENGRRSTGQHAILDIGTGSGCIAVTLALDIPGVSVTAWDISEEALAVARANAAGLGADVRFVRQDALNPPDDAGEWDAIVSNPPYICDRERASMERNVLDHEPHIALFVPDGDPLIFYRSVADYAVKALRPGGRLYFEINPIYADELAAMLRETGLCGVGIVRDEYGKERFAVARKAGSGEATGNRMPVCRRKRHGGRSAGCR